MNKTGKIRSILIVDDHELARSGIEMAVNQLSNAQVVASLDCGRNVLSVVQAQNIDIVLLDLNLPDISGLEILIQLAVVHELAVIVLTGENHAGDFHFALKMGARGVVSKADPIECIRDAINSLGQTEPYLSPKARQILGSEAQASVSLSPRQMAILHYLDAGETNKEIAYRLGIAAPTVSFHLKELRTKLDVRGNKKILNRALELGLLSPSAI